ncbi:EF-P lysine aminoacylase GenX [Flagellatimonas centrodinii]|uniref:EF-P lysine aminoacylase EpmA n=1 Tax=Flagellatimonas centrodinii TaxID=2806210 RepID=UPI001FFB9895|nr:EF-P lysine aminoacylase EpmA [Flagellatimonas centrodinii]ULQ46669.1 EF-P lysine aminoacylase GenX [Flagellatimonas centrodinii]
MAPSSSRRTGGSPEGIDPYWAPTATIEQLKARADLYRSIRAFFDARGVMEVETPILSAHATVDRHIDSFAAAPHGFLHTSPEFAMKRLLCAGSGPIWQIAKVFRAEESGRYHNPEFSLLEWYRPGYDHHRLMDEVEALLRGLGAVGPFARLTYAEAFRCHAGFDPETVALDHLRTLPEAEALDDGADRDTLLDLWMSFRVGPELGREFPCFLHDFPASQAALSRVVAGKAQRFELFWDGLELANGFHELADADEQQRRFEADQARRQAEGRPVPPYDRHLIAALHAGLPDCAGVALGLDRLLMRLTGAASLAEVMAFDSGRA